ncbi:MAG TPA: indolepyruvate oxidoreductase subunit beta [Spirochaetota bacterium]|nr:indolepyruvate oxidoreductase subunit beta [Spirochaetota bacterium]
MMKSVVFAGVGGQGVILASKVLMETAMNAGYDVRESEVHGMAQRGGSVECNVRFGKKVYSPLIPKGGADFVIAFEMLEALRKLEYLNDDGKLIVNRFQITPSSVQNGDAEYPTDIEPWIIENVKNQLFVDTAEALKTVGNAKSLNIMMLGVLSQYLDFTTEDWHSAIRSLVKPKFIDLNISAFEKGRELSQ